MIFTKTKYIAIDDVANINFITACNMKFIIVFTFWINICDGNELNSYLNPVMIGPPLTAVELEGSSYSLGELSPLTMGTRVAKEHSTPTGKMTNQQIKWGTRKYKTRRLCIYEVRKVAHPSVTSHVPPRVQSFSNMKGDEKCSTVSAILQ